MFLNHEEFKTTLPNAKKLKTKLQHSETVTVHVTAKVNM